MDSARLQFRRVDSLAVVIVYELERYRMFNAFNDIERL